MIIPEIIARSRFRFVFPTCVIVKVQSVEARDNCQKLRKFRVFFFLDCDFEKFFSLKAKQVSELEEGDKHAHKHLHIRGREFARAVV